MFFGHPVGVPLPSGGCSSAIRWVFPCHPVNVLRPSGECSSAIRWVFPEAIPEVSPEALPAMRSRNRPRSESASSSDFSLGPPLQTDGILQGQASSDGKKNLFVRSGEGETLCRSHGQVQGRSRFPGCHTRS